MGGSVNIPMIYQKNGPVSAIDWNDYISLIDANLGFTATPALNVKGTFALPTGTTVNVIEASGSGPTIDDNTLWTSAQIDAHISLEDLDFQGDSGTGSVDLDSQVLDIAGGTNITTVAGSQTLTVNLDAVVAIATSLDVGSTIAMVGTLDDDTMATATATTWSTSESIKAYADAGDFWSRDAGNGYLYPETLTDRIGFGTNTPDANVEIEDIGGDLTRLHIDGQTSANSVPLVGIHIDSGTHGADAHFKMTAENAVGTDKAFILALDPDAQTISLNHLGVDAIVIDSSQNIDINTNQIGYDGSAGGLSFNSGHTATFSHSVDIVGALSVTSGQKIYPDGGSNSYWWEPTADEMAWVLNTVEKMRLSATGLVVGGDLTLTGNDIKDGGGSNWITSNGSQETTIAKSLTTGGDIFIPATSKFYPDGGSDSYWWEPTANEMAWVLGTVEEMRLAASGLTVNGMGNFTGTVGIKDTGHEGSGLTINQGASDDIILSLKSSDVAQPATDFAEADTFLALQKIDAAYGGAHFLAFTDNGDAESAFKVTGCIDEGGECFTLNGVAPSGTGFSSTGNYLLVINNNDVEKFSVNYNGDTSIGGDLSVTENATITGSLTTSGGRIVKKIRKTFADTPYTIPAAMEELFYNTDGGNSVANLPAGVDSQRYRIINTGSNQLTVNPNGAENLMGANSGFVLNQGESLIATYDTNDGWF